MIGAMLTRRRMVALGGMGAAAWLARARSAGAYPADDEGMRLPREPEPEPDPPPPPPRWLLTDELMPAEESWRNDLLPVAVSLDNFPFGSRPQMGMDKADLVYELLVEGGITRFLAVFHSRECEWIEPVRSARTPMLYVARELGALVGHIGAASTSGPADADSQFGWWGIHHFDGDVSKAPFWRDRRRVAPHNAVTSTLELRGHGMGLGWFGPSDLSPWFFKDDGGDEAEPHEAADSLGYGFALVFGAQGTMNASWAWDAESNLYFRRMAGVPHADGITGEQLTAKNVVVQVAPGWVGSREGHILYDLIGEGRARVFRDGRVFEAVWSKRWREDRTRFWHPSGEEIRLNRGTTWVALLPAGSPYWWA
jgi:hypothetical protein